MKLRFIVLLLLSVSAWGQTYPTSVSVSILGCPLHEVIKPILDGAGKKTGEACVVPDEKQPLTCAKYQHVEHWSGRCGPQPNQCDSDSMTCTAVAICTPVPPDHCVDDMHEVTEREWQDLKAHLRTLERLICVTGNGTLKMCLDNPPRKPETKQE
jgi:hypothetical protein